MSVDLRLVASLAHGAYHLDERETEGPRLNSGSTGADRAYRSADGQLQFLGSNDVSVPTGNTKFGANGLENGIYTRANAAALVGHDGVGTLYIAFRGTNDNNGDVGIRTDTPDENHWFNKKDHYALFAPLIAGLDAYAAANGIDKLVITGHSLGASIVEALVDEIRDTKLFDGIDVEAVNFASPGYAGASNENKDLTTFNLRGDIVPFAAIFSNNAGDENWIYHNVDDGIHAMSLHAAMLDFFADSGLTFAAFNDLFGIDYDRIHVNVHHAARATGGKDPATKAFMVGEGKNTITATEQDDILLGGNGNDLLYAYGGNDYLDGGADKDTMYGGSGADTLFGRHGIDTMKGGGNADVLLGGSHGDTIKGQDGGDRLAGENGKDRLNGGAGADYLYGGKDNDNLTGGPGTDHFIFQNDGSKDTVKDFTSTDVLVVESNIDAVTRTYSDGITLLDLYDGSSYAYSIRLEGRFTKDFLLQRLDTDGFDRAMDLFADYLLG